MRVRYGVYDIVGSAVPSVWALVERGKSDNLGGALTIAGAGTETDWPVLIIDHQELDGDQHVFVMRAARKVDWETRSREAVESWDKRWLLIESASRRLREQIREELVEEVVQAVFDVLALKDNWEYPE